MAQGRLAAGVQYHQSTALGIAAIDGPVDV
jgi:hypothetical protein